MKILNPKLLKKYRGPGLCDLCGRKCNYREAAHIIAKGMGGHRQMDIRINILALGGAFDKCHCHHKQHNSAAITEMEMIEAVAKREKLWWGHVRVALYFLRHLDNSPYLWQVEAAMEELEPEARELAAEVLGRVLGEVGK